MQEQNFSIGKAFVIEDSNCLIIAILFPDINLAHGYLKRYQLDWIWLWIHGSTFQEKTEGKEVLRKWVWDQDSTETPKGFLGNSSKNVLLLRVCFVPFPPFYVLVSTLNGNYFCELYVDKIIQVHNFQCNPFFLDLFNQYCH